MGIKSEGELKMKKTIVLLLSLATIMGCVAAPVSALASSRNWKFSWEYRFVGISMEKSVLNCEYKGSGALGVIGLVGVSIAARVFPSEKNAADELAERGFARLVSAEHHVELRRKRAHRFVPERAE